MCAITIMGITMIMATRIRTAIATRTAMTTATIMHTSTSMITTTITMIMRIITSMGQAADAATIITGTSTITDRA